MKAKSVVIAILAFGLGLTVGIWWPKSASVVVSSVEEIGQAEEKLVEQDDEMPSLDNEVSSDEAGTPCPEDEAVPPATVEVIVDDSAEPTPEMRAAHAARRARRQVMREQRARERRKFLSDFNVALLSPEQREVHSLYLEALAARDDLRKEISTLRAEGKGVSVELQARLSDAESVLRADRDAEFRALREAAARAAGLDETAIHQLMDDLLSIESHFMPPHGGFWGGANGLRR